MDGQIIHIYGTIFYLGIKLNLETVIIYLENIIWDNKGQGNIISMGNVSFVERF